MNAQLLQAAPLLLGLGLSMQAQAVALGDLQVASYLGQRFSGTIELSGDDLQSLQPDCFSPVQPVSQSSQGLPWISKYSISLKRDKGRSRLLLTTAKSLDEPLLTLGLRVGCGADVIREYVVLLSPPMPSQPVVALAKSAQVTEQVKPAALREPKPAPKSQPRHRAHTWIIGDGESVQSLAASLYPDNAKMRKVFAKAVYQANPDLAMEYSSRDVLPTGLALEVPDLRTLSSSAAASEPSPIAAPARQRASSGATDPEPSQGLSVAPAAGKSQDHRDRLVIGTEPVLDVYPGDEAFHARLADTRSELEQLNQFVASNLHQGSAPAQDPGVLELQTRLAALQLAIEQIRMAEAGALAAVEPVAAAPAKATEAVVPPPAPAPVARIEPEARSLWEMLLLGGSLGLVGIGLGAWLGYRRRLEKPEWMQEQTPPQHQGKFPNPDSGFGAAMLQGVFRPRVAPKDEALEAGYDLPQVQEISSGRNPIEFTDLTDFMLATGRLESAADFLRDFIEAEPDKALTPWIKLLMSYQKLGKEKEFCWVAHQLRLHFNVAEIRWDDNLEPLSQTLESELPHLGKAPHRSLEEIPHICRMVVSLWGKPACYKYLESLLRDNREGQRQGFGLSVVQEILFLMSLLQQEEYAEKRLI